MGNLTAFRQSFSFRKPFRKLFWASVAVDGLFLGLLFWAFSSFTRFLQNRSLEIFGGRTPEQIQQLMLTAPEQIAPYAGQVQSLLLASLAIFLLLLLFFFLLFGVSRAYLWTMLQGRPLSSLSFSRHWKWQALNLALLIPLALYGIAALLVRLVFGFLFQSLATISPVFYFQHQVGIDRLLALLNNAVAFLLLVFLLVLLFLVYDSFAEKRLVGASLGKGLRLLKAHWKEIWPALLFMVLVAFVLTAALLPFQETLRFYAGWSLAVNLGLLVLYLAWVRLYVLKIIANHPEPSQGHHSLAKT